MTRLRTLAFLPLLALPLAAHAADLGLAKSYNAFIFGSASWNGGGESEGPLAVGGSLSTTGATNVNIHQHTAPAIGAKANPTFLVGGGVTAGNGGQFNGGNGYVGGTFGTTNPFNLNNGSTLTVGGSISGTVQGGAATQNAGAGLVPASIFTGQKAYSQTQSSYIAGLTTNVTTITAANITDQNQFYLNVASLPSLSPAYPTVKVVRMSGALQQAFSSLNLFLQNQGTDTVIFDVTGSSVDWKWKNNPNGDFSRMLFNFNGASTLGVGLNGADQFNGSVLAPNTAISMNSRIQGNVIANSLNVLSGVELHFGAGKTFQGVVPQAVPEPASMVALGAGALALLRRRRK